MPPVISIVVPAYNAAAFLQKTIEAVLHQTFSDWELIIINNASKDETGAVIDRIASRQNDSRIRVITHARTLPANENWNSGVQEARGKFIKMICADDIPTLDCVERQVRILSENPNVSLVAGARTIINRDGQPLFTRSCISKPGVHDGRAMIRWSILSGTNSIGDPVVATWRASAMRQVGMFDPTVLYCPDIEFWWRLLTVGDLYYETQPCGFYRIHGNAAATGLADVAVRDFLYCAQLQVKRGSVTLSEIDRSIIAFKSHVNNIARKLIYRLLS
jgi:glycosyltransferase involved in cell wall biosynthesis